MFIKCLYTKAKTRRTSQQLREKGLQRGKAASYKIALAILYIDIAFQKNPEARRFAKLITY